MIVKSDTAPYLDAFRARPREKEKNLPPWVTARREASLARFAELGFPTRRQEAWRFTNLAALQRAAFPPAPALVPMRYRLALEPYVLPDAGHRLLFMDGQVILADAPFTAPGVWFGTTADALVRRPELAEAAFDASETADAQPFVALNGAFFADGFILALEPGAVLEQPLQIIHLSHTAGHSAHPRSAILAGAGSRATIVETFLGGGASWTNAVTRIRLDAGASVRHVTLQDSAVDSIHFAHNRVTLGRDARYDSFVLTLGAQLSRQESVVAMAGEGATVGLNGAYLLRGTQEATTVAFVDHQAPGGTTRELWKGVVDGRAHGVFLGTIAVRPDAQKTDAQQTNKNLLLSRRAAVDTKPQLEILADDVKCSHGAAVGDLDEAALFYLRARGIAEDEARRMLIEGFAADALDTVGDAALRAHLAGHVQRWLSSPSPQRAEGRGEGAVSSVPDEKGTAP
jgi:Fe-S cluster assembly protein SufD